MIDIDGMVEGLAVLLDDADAPPRFPGRLENDLLEEGLIDEMGAGEGQDKAGRADALESQTVDVLVAPAGRDDVGPLLGEGRRIEDDVIVVEGRLAEEFEDVGREEQPRVGGQAVELEIVLGQGDSRLRGIDGIGPDRAAEDYAEMADHGCNAVLLAVSEFDWWFWRKNIIRLVDAAKDHGLRAYVDLWGWGKTLAGEPPTP